MTKISRIAPRCPLNGLTWRKPRFSHIVVFHRRNRPFQLCMNLHSPGMAIYRLKGTSKQPVASANASGNLGCFESECKHLTFLIQPKIDGMAVQRLQFTYNYSQIASKLLLPSHLAHQALIFNRKSKMYCSVSTIMSLQQPVW